MIGKITNILLVLVVVFGFNLVKTDFFGVQKAKAQSAILDISISQENLTVEGGTASIKVTVTVNNTSSVVADHVRVDLPITPEMTIDESSMSKGDYDGQFLGDKIVWLLPDMLPGKKYNLAFQYRLNVVSTVQKYYVAATNGNDANAGTLAQPLKTIAGARDKIVAYRKANGGVLDKPIEVNIRAGRYYFDTDIGYVAFGDDDSGTSEYPITYKKYDADKDEVVFVGGAKVTIPWTKVPGKSYYKTNIGTATKPNNLIISNGANNFQATLARDPNPNDGNGYYIAETPPISPSTTNCEYLKRDARDTSALSTNPTDIRVHSYVRFTETDVPVKSINDNTRTIKTYLTDASASPDIKKCYNGGYTDIEGTKGKVRYTLENVFEKLDIPGEWYYDPLSGDLYYWPRAEDNISNVLVEYSKTPTILYFDSAHDINIKGVKFIGTQTDYLATNDITRGALNESGAIRVANTSYLKIIGNKFYGTGTNGINVNPNGNALYSHVLIQKNTFDNVGVTPISMLGNMDTSKKITPNYSAIINNKFINSGTVKTTQVVQVSNVSGSLVENNYIDGAGYSGIRASYANTDVKGVPVPEAFSSTLPLTVISKNWVTNVMQKLNDGGGIYAYHARDIPISIDNNIVSNLVATDFHYDLKSGFEGIYLDEGQSNTSITNNLVYNSSGGINTNMSGVNNRVVNNILAKIIKYGLYASYTTEAEYNNGNGTTPRNENEKMLIKNNIFDFVVSASREIKFMMARQMIRYSDKNLFSRAVLPVVNTKKRDIEWNPYTETNVIGQKDVEYYSIVADPKFIIPSDNNFKNFKLDPSSPAIVNLGFKIIDFSKVGTNW